MKLQIIAVGAKMPGWVDAGFENYARRLPRECALSLIEVPLPTRAKTVNRADAVAREGQKMLRKINPDDEVIALTVDGNALTTSKLAARLEAWLGDGRDRIFLIGGPDGLSPDCLERADWRWSLSPLTLPHGLARIVTAEALYRAWTLHQGHPYHRP